MPRRPQTGSRRRATRIVALLGGWLLIATSAWAQAPGAADDTTELARLEADAQARGCDPLDASNCLLPFPSDHFTREVPPDAIGGTDRGGTGRLVDLDPLAMPRNITGKPVDPSEWNRNDGFSPAQMLATYVPDVALVRDADGNPTGPIVGAPPISDVARSLEPDSGVVVVDAETGERHPVWAEIDLNAGFLYPPGGEEKPDEPKPAFMIRPAVNFTEGHRYVVALRDLQDASGAPLEASAFFQACRDGGELPTPALADRCTALRDGTFPVLAESGVELDDGLYLAWDFTVASTTSTVGRLKHMRDDAFTGVLGQQETPDGEIADLGAAPAFEVHDVRQGTDAGEAFDEIHGTMEVPSYVVPPDPSPLDRAEPTRAALDALEENGGGDAADVVDIGSSASLPPNRLHYDPTDELHPDDPAMQPYGDGLPDRTGTMTVPWMCRLYEDATPSDPARAGIYGHGLLDRRQAISYDAVPELSTFDPEHNFQFCAADWFGFATGDLGNVVTATFDASLFPVIPDATQQGLLNFLFLARLLRHPDGFASSEAFQAGGEPRFDNGEVFYHGISQGGILGGAVLAASKDISRGVLGVPGASYSLLLRRSTGFSGDIVDGIPVSFSNVIYTGYPDDLDRTLLLSMVQMLWDRGENNGYAAHIADNSALEGPDNQVMLRPVFADHQVTHWAAYDMARTVLRSNDGEDFLADLYPRDCSAGVPFCYPTREAFHADRNPDAEFLYGLPVSGVEAFPSEREHVPYDDPADGTRSPLSGLIQWDEGRTATPPLGNIPANWKDGEDPHGFARDAAGALCQQSHFLWGGGGLIDVRGVRTGDPCPPLPAPEEDPDDGKGRPPWAPGPPPWAPGPPGR